MFYRRVQHTLVDKYHKLDSAPMSILAETVGAPEPQDEAYNIGATINVKRPDIESPLASPPEPVLFAPPPPSRGVQPSRSRPSMKPTDLNDVMSNELPALDSGNGFDFGAVDVSLPLPNLSSGVFGSDSDHVDEGFDDAALRVQRRPRQSLVGNLDSVGRFDSLAMNSIGLPQIPDERIGLERGDTMEGNSGIFPITQSGLLPVLPEFDDEKGKGNEQFIVRRCRVCDKEMEPGNGVFVAGFCVHRTCLSCRKCQVGLRDNKCVWYKGEYYCMDCATMASKHNCAVCGCNIDPCDKEVSLADGRNVHVSCIVCFTCSKALDIDEFVMVQGRIFCKGCSAEMRERVCKRCGELVIENGCKRCGKWFHTDHFTCEVCGCKLKSGFYVVHHGKFYCQNHGYVFSHSCEYCKVVIPGPETPQLMWNNKLYHTECLVCRVCGTPLNPVKAKKFHNRPHCSECHRLRLSEKERGRDSHKHNPMQTASRRLEFQEQGVQIVDEPNYLREVMTAKFEFTDSKAMNGRAFEPELESVLDLEP